MFKYRQTCSMSVFAKKFSQRGGFRIDYILATQASASCNRARQRPGVHTYPAIRERGVVV